MCHVVGLAVVFGILGGIPIGWALRGPGRHRRIGSTNGPS